MITAMAWANPVSMLPFGAFLLRMHASQLSVWAFRLSSCLTGGTSVPPGRSTGSGLDLPECRSKTPFDPQRLRGSGTNHHCGLPSPPGEPVEKTRVSSRIRPAFSTHDYAPGPVFAFASAAALPAITPVHGIARKLPT